MKKNRHNVLKAGGLLSLIIIGFVTAILISSNMNTLNVEPVWAKDYPLKPLRDADPGEGASGVLTAFCYPHSADPANTYNVNITNGWYAQGDDNNSHIGSAVPYDTAFDVVFKVLWNKTHCYNTTGTQFELGWVKGFGNSTDLGASDVSLLEYNITGCTATDFIWVYYVDNNGGSGYTINRGENITGYVVDFSSFFS